MYLKIVKVRFISLLTKLIELLPTLLVLFVLIYLISPLRIWEKFVFPNQVEIFVVVSYLTIFIICAHFFQSLIIPLDFKFALSSIDILLLLYASYLGCHYLLQFKTQNPEFLTEYFILIVLYISFRNAKNKPKSWLLWFFPAIAIVQIFHGIKNQTDSFAPVHRLSEITGIFDNTGIFGGFIAVAIVVTIGLILDRQKTKPPNSSRKSLQYRKTLLLTAIPILLIQLKASNSRAAWCSCFAGALYIIATPLGLRQKFLNLSRFRKWAVRLVSLGLIVILLFGLYQYKKDSANGRLLIWTVSLEMIKEKPLFGCGPGGFKANYMEYQATYLASNPESSFSNLADDNTYAFNEFLRIWVEYGAIGLLLFVLLLLFLFFSNNSLNENRLIATAKASLLALLVFSLFSYPMEVFQFNLISIFFTTLITKHSPTIKYFQFDRLHFRKSQTIKYRKISMVAIIICWLVTATFLIRSITNYATACKKWNSALIGFSETSYIKSIGMLESVYPQLKNNGIFLTTYGKALCLSGQHTKAIPVLQRANCFLSSTANYIELGRSYNAINDFQNAKTAWSKASYMTPSLFTPKYLMAKMLYKNNKLAEAQKIALELLNKEVKVWSPQLQIILEELKELLETIDKTSKTDIIYP